MLVRLISELVLNWQSLKYLTTAKTTTTIIITTTTTTI
jgi:hypothetical protein